MECVSTCHETNTVKVFFINVSWDKLFVLFGGWTLVSIKRIFKTTINFFFNSIKIIQTTGYKYKYRDHQFLNVINYFV